MLDQERDVLAAFGQRRHANGNDVQAMEKVLAEAPFGNLAPQIARRRRQHAHIDAHRRSAADALEGLVDKDAQDLALRFERHVRDFIEEERSAMRALEHADPPRAARRLFDAEEFDLDAVRHHGRGVERDKRPARAARAHVEEPRRHFLARSRRAGDQDAASRRRHLVDRLTALVD